MLSPVQSANASTQADLEHFTAVPLHPLPTETNTTNASFQDNYEEQLNKNLRDLPDPEAHKSTVIFDQVRDAPPAYQARRYEKVKTWLAALAVLLLVGLGVMVVVMVATRPNSLDQSTAVNDTTIFPGSSNSAKPIVTTTSDINITVCTPSLDQGLTPERPTIKAHEDDVRVMSTSGGLPGAEWKRDVGSLNSVASVSRTTTVVATSIQTASPPDPTTVVFTSVITLSALSDAATSTTSSTTAEPKSPSGASSDVAAPASILSGIMALKTVPAEPDSHEPLSQPTTPAVAPTIAPTPAPTPVSTAAPVGLTSKKSHGDDNHVMGAFGGLPGAEWRRQVSFVTAVSGRVPSSNMTANIITAAGGSVYLWGPPIRTSKGLAEA